MMSSYVTCCHLLCVAKRVLICNTLIISKRWGAILSSCLLLNLLNFFVGFFLDSIPIPNPLPQEVPSLMQDEHGNAIGNNEWVHESSRGCCKINACTIS
jgi:hypothetical protein